MPYCNINELHMLEDMAGMYTSGSAHMVVTEAIANAIEGNSDRINIVLKNQSIAFIDNGAGMNKREFKRYHDIAGQNKKKGSGIGFAGIGAKVYLGAWRNSKIKTSTVGDDGALASQMYITRNNKIMWDSIETNDIIPIRGTRYEVMLKKTDYEILEKSLEKIILDVFNPALLNGVKIFLNEIEILPWKPLATAISHEAIVEKKKYPMVISLLSTAGAPKKFMQYHVMGKIISIKAPEWAAEISAKYQSRIHVYVDAIKMSNQLNTNKESFNRCKTTGDFYRGIEAHAYRAFQKAGWITNDAKDTTAVQLDGLLEEVFKTEAWLNPFATRPFTRSNEKTNPREPKQELETPDVETPTPETESESIKTTRTRHIKLVNVSNPSDMRAGWINPADGLIVLNESHPVYLKHKNDKAALNHVAKSVIFSTLIRNGSKARDIPVSEAFDLMNRVMTNTRDIIVI